MPEVTENYIRIPVKNSEDYAELRTIWLSEKDGIKAIYGRKKDSKDWEIVTYLFDKEKWTEAEAKKWVDEHKDKTARLMCRYLGRTTKLEGKVPEWIHLIPIGKWKGHPEGDFEITKEFCEQIVANFEARETDIPIDYEHQTENTFWNGQPAPAAGWIDKLEVRDNGVWGHVKEWMDEAAGMIRKREYRYLSPVWVDDWIDSETGESTGPAILSCGLTNVPFFDELTPLVAKFKMKHSGKEQTMTLEELVAKLGELLGLSEPTAETVVTKVEELVGVAEEVVQVVEEENPAPEAVAKAAKRLKAEAVLLAKVREILKVDKTADEKAISAKLFSLTKPPDGKEHVSRQEFDDMKTRLAKQDAAKAVDAAMSEGKLTPAQRDWALEYAEKNPEGFGKWVATQPVVVPVGDRRKEEPRKAKAGVTEQQKTICAKLNISPEETFGDKKDKKGDK